MLLNPSEYIKTNFFKEKFEEKIVIVSDTDIETKNPFEKFQIQEPVWQILALSKKYKFVFVVLDRLNWDNIFRLYKNLPSNVCVINLNAGYTGLGKKVILADLDDIYINPQVQVKEPMDFENFKFLVNEFLENPTLTHIRVPSKDMEERIGNEEICLDYDEIIDFSEYGISGYNGAVLCYGSMLQESLNAVGLLQAEGLWVDLYWLGDYKKFSVDFIKKLESQERIFVIGDFDAKLFRDYFYSKFCEFGLEGKEIHFIYPENLQQVVPEFLSEQVKMQPTDIYEKIHQIIQI